jgi:uncharacterized membrane protein
MDSTPPTNTPPNSSTGLATNVASLLAYLLGWITGLVFLLVEKKDETVRWHAAQSFIFSLGVTVIFMAISIISVILAFVPVIRVVSWILASLLSPLLSIGVLILWILLMVKAYQGQKMELPIVKDFIPAILKIGL